MRLRLGAWTPVWIGGDYGGTPPMSGVTFTWFHARFWEASIAARRRLVEEVRRIEEVSEAEGLPPIKLGHTRDQTTLEERLTKGLLKAMVEPAKPCRAKLSKRRPL